MYVILVSGGSRGGAWGGGGGGRPPLVLDQKEARKAEKIFLSRASPPATLSQGLDNRPSTLF